jgi:hypothetical protein
MTVSKARSTGSPTDPLDAVYRDLVGIHASIAEALSSDPKIMPWAMREIDGVLDGIKQGPREKEPATSERKMLAVVARRLATIHAAIEASSDDDRDIVPWTERGIMGLIREIDAFRLGAGR